jgi:PEP-CTERM motif
VFTSYNNPAYTYLDNVSLIAVPEPAACMMMIVGFGGLGLAGFRKARKASVSTS